MILRITFKDANLPKVINVTTDKYFFPDERDKAKSEAARLLREKDPAYIKRKFEVEIR